VRTSLSLIAPHPCVQLKAQRRRPRSCVLVDKRIVLPRCGAPPSQDDKCPGTMEEVQTKLARQTPCLGLKQADWSKVSKVQGGKDEKCSRVKRTWVLMHL
jgi:hypothetical protein